jgi:hypothetical protein
VQAVPRDFEGDDHIHDDYEEEGENYRQALYHKRSDSDAAKILDIVLYLKIASVNSSIEGVF